MTPVLQQSESDLAFERLAGWAGVVAGIAGAVYALAFVVLRHDLLAGLALLVAPLAATAVLVAVYRRVAAAGSGLAVWALVLALAGSFGAVAHGGYNLANAIRPPEVGVNVPFPADPRGLFTFGLTGLALLGFARLAGRTPEIPSWVMPLGFVLGAVLIVTYLGRLIVFEATSPLVLGPALIAGVLSPAFYVGLGWWFLRGGQRGVTSTAGA